MLRNRSRLQRISGMRLVCVVQVLISAVAANARQPLSSPNCLPSEQGKICYRHLPAGWYWDANQSKKLGIDAIFHQRGNEHRVQPMITLDASDHYPWFKISEHVKGMIAEYRQAHPHAQIVSEKFTRPKFQTTIVSYRNFWQIVAWRDLGQIVVMTELQCRDAVLCAPYVTNFKAFVRSLTYSVSAIPSTYKKMNGGILYGKNWMILFGNMPWINDTDLAKHLGINEIFYPANWDPRYLSPYISVAFSQKDRGVTVASEMARDAASMRKHEKYVEIRRGSTFRWKKGKAEVQTFAYKNGWDLTAYSDAGAVIFLTTLHCQRQAQCKAYLPLFFQFVPTLRYVANVTVIDRTHSR